jgi:hypothetical protein
MPGNEVLRRSPDPVEPTPWHDRELTILRWLERLTTTDMQHIAGVPPGPGSQLGCPLGDQLGLERRVGMSVLLRHPIL